MQFCSIREVETMKRSRFNEEQNIGILKEAEATSVKGDA
jgi:hypothetical protein